MARIKAIRASGQASLRVDRFAQDRTQANLLNQVRGARPAIASALNFIAAFCELRDVRPFPASEQLALKWRSVFSDSATFANYASHMQKVCFPI